MAARFDCKKLLHFAVATLCLLALAMLMPVAVNAADASIKSDNETVDLTISEGAASVFFKRKGSADEDEKNTGHVWLEVYVLQDSGSLVQLGSAQEFKYQYNSHIDTDLYDHYNPATNSFIKDLADKKDKKHGAGTGGYASLDLGVNVSDGYTLYKVDYTVCYSSGGPTNTGWKDNANFTGNSVSGPTQYYYLDNITDGTTVQVYIMPTYTIKYEVMYGENVIDAADYGTYFTPTDGLNDVTAYPKDAEYSIAGCEKLKKMTPDNYKEEDANNSVSTPKIYPYHRWCDHENELSAVNLAVSRFMDGYTVATTVTVPTLTEKEGYKVSGWKVDENNTVGFGDPVNMSGLTQYADENRVITLTAVVEVNTPNTDNTGNNNGNGDNGGNNGGDGGNGGTTDGDNNNNGGDSGNNGGKESTPTPTPETTPTSTPSVTTVTAVAPTATPTATPAPTAEPTATPAPAAVSAHIPQTSDDMPYTLLVVTALASLCAAGALFMKRRSK